MVNNRKWKPWVVDPRRKGRLYLDHYGFDWKSLKFWKSDYWKLIKDYLKERRELGHNVIPNSYEIMFRSLVMTPFDRTKIVILGQDPYYTKGVTDGLAFSILPNKISVPTARKKGAFDKSFYPSEKTEINGQARRAIPGSLKRIFDEYREDTGYPQPLTGDLSTWARNGILLANMVWSVEEGRPKSHYRIKGKYAWQELTCEILEQLSIRRDKLVFILWGKVAQEYSYMIDSSKHLILKGAHPTPRNISLTAKDGIPFRGGQYFTKACDYLGIDKRIWRLP